MGVAGGVATEGYCTHTHTTVQVTDPGGVVRVELEGVQGVVRSAHGELACGVLGRQPPGQLQPLCPRG